MDKDATEFNTYFSTIGQVLANDILEYQNISPNTQQNMIPNIMFLMNTNETEVKENIFSLKNNKALGIDGITLEVLEKISKYIAKFLPYMVNLGYNITRYLGAEWLIDVELLSEDGDCGWENYEFPLSEDVTEIETQQVEQEQEYSDTDTPVINALETIMEVSETAVADPDTISATTTSVTNKNKNCLLKYHRK
ncbi:hypothetical protein JTB14_007951 [Gonioctena quinquepunctata]|nr:hypothetical protein JTB14_007951 [Gonioctena quinquepunctata]